MSAQETSIATVSINRSCTNNTRLIRTPVESIRFVVATARKPSSTSSFVTVFETAERRTMVVDGVSVGTLDGVALGSPLGLTEGITLGEKLGEWLGELLGTPEGDELGTSEGDALGTSLGRTYPKTVGGVDGDSLGAALGALDVDGALDADGAPLGDVDGTSLGTADGTIDGTSLGDADGTSLGDGDGTSLGTADGTIDGTSLGDADGTSLGTADGTIDGTSLGDADGTSLGDGDGTLEGTSLGEGVVTSLLPDGLPVGAAELQLGLHIEGQKNSTFCSVMGSSNPQKFSGSLATQVAQFCLVLLSNRKKGSSSHTSRGIDGATVGLLQSGSHIEGQKNDTSSFASGS